jgi:hypothetical protein
MAKALKAVSTYFDRSGKGYVAGSMVIAVVDLFLTLVD